MGGGPDINFPGPTPEELALQREQVELLRQQRDVLSRQMREQSLLAPFLFQEAGVQPIFNTPDEEGNLPNPDLGEGEIIAFEAIDDEARRLSDEVELGFLNRTLAALEGNLPVDPALERSLEELEANEFERLRRNLGPGFETSTPGQEGIQRLRETQENLRDAARRGDLTLAEQLGASRNAINENAVDSFFNRLFGQNQNQVGIATGFGGNAAGFNGPLNRLFANRQGQFQASLANARAGSSFASGLFGMFGSIGGGLASNPGLFN